MVIAIPLLPLTKLTLSCLDPRAFFWGYIGLYRVI